MILNFLAWDGNKGTDFGAGTANFFPDESYSVHDIHEFWQEKYEFRREN